MRLGDAAAGPAGQIKPGGNRQLRAAHTQTGNMPPRYPLEAALRRQRGTVHTRIHVDARGQVTAIDILPPVTYGALNEAVRQAVMSWKFTPAEKDGHPVATTVPLDFVFE